MTVVEKRCPEPRGRHEYNERWVCVRCGRQHHSHAQGVLYRKPWGWSHQPPRNLSDEWFDRQRRRALRYWQEHPYPPEKWSYSTQKRHALLHFGLPLTGWPRKPHPLSEWRKGECLLKSIRERLKRR